MKVGEHTTNRGENDNTTVDPLALQSFPMQGECKPTIIPGQRNI